ncbi:TPA: hypothetical protein UL242_002470 [Clostridioides difficile]|uniref:hypothetical protein n=1 Tax=Clostridioides difficile TaxID=1496 RepID=UPI000BB1C6AB|nr:hypothetical protein [Clostridioides difficile]EGT3642406.1 hypothetical protein [Clostridioides difficile]MBH7167666.1 hypothetical protein [Clostridioides difficile]MBH7846530.1 hypothetical protein [Clostridioides difficile]MBY1346176.1 hypothetical protein [Clostridioides difficile]MBY1660738.1 hypothetical protein [Clostridioides difficile]
MNDLNNFLRDYKIYEEMKIKLEEIKYELIQVCVNLDYNEVVERVDKLNYNDALTIFVLLREYGAEEKLLKKIFDILYLKKSAIDIYF